MFSYFLRKYSLSMSNIGTLHKATKSSSPLDPIPLSLLHEITESLTIPLNNIFCESLKSGTFLKIL